MASNKYWVWLTRRRGVGTLTAVRLLDRFGTPERVYFAQAEEYDQIEALSATGKYSLSDKSLEETERILADCDRLGYRLLTLQDSDYPERLKNIPDPPLLLYLRGRLPHVDEELVIGIVGTRNPTPYGEKVTREITHDLTRAGCVICSGIARGLDTVALRTALNARGKVISVVAGGLDVPYPKENAYLYEDIAAVGALLSEYPPGTPSFGEHYRPRNRIIGGLSEGVLVVEGGRTSGTLITAHAALEQGREVFAIPGNVDAPQSVAPNRLIQANEARLVCKGADILEEFSLRYPLKIAKPALSPQEKEQRLEGGREIAPHPPKLSPPQRPVLSPKEEEGLSEDQRELMWVLDQGMRHPDELVEETQIPAQRVLSALTLLQVQGYIKEEAGKRFSALVRLQEWRDHNGKD